MTEEKEMELKELVSQLQEENRRLKSELEVLKSKNSDANDSMANHLIEKYKAK